MKTRSSLRRALAERQAQVFNARMLRALILTAAVGLAACAASPAAESGSNADLAFALGSDQLQRQRSAPMPRRRMHRSVAWRDIDALHFALSAREGRFCIATGCEDALFEPKLTRAPGWTATMRTNDRTDYAADLEIARDLRTFTLRQAGSSSIDTWTGECSPAGS